MGRGTEPFRRNQESLSIVLGAPHICVQRSDDNGLQADRKTTIRVYMDSHGDIMAESLPPELAERYGG